MRTVCQNVIVTHFTSLLRPKWFAPTRSISYATLLMSGTLSPGTCALSFTMTQPTSTSSGFLSGETEPCHDPQQVSIGYLADPTTFASYEPKDLAEKQRFTCQAVVLPQTKHSFDVRLC